MDTKHLRDKSLEILDESVTIREIMMKEIQAKKDKRLRQTAEIEEAIDDLDNVFASTPTNVDQVVKSLLQGAYGVLDGMSFNGDATC